ncbi:unnamed protein product [Amoebophrya sp. A25]|nr:unnamed protein product [Amoebophrya sp. A25]|eukprot:GSA25T00018911001.1
MKGLRFSFFRLLYRDRKLWHGLKALGIRFGREPSGS